MFAALQVSLVMVFWPSRVWSTCTARRGPMAPPPSGDCSPPSAS